MNFLNLHYFLVAVEEMNLTKAAQRLYISQQALSAHIANLEKELGVPLFCRTPVLSLTCAGEHLWEKGIRILALRQELDQEVEEISGNLRGQLRIGISYTRGQALLPYVLPTYLAKHPKVEIKLLEEQASTLDELLQNDECDLMISTNPRLVNVADTIKLMPERLFLVVPTRFLADRFGENVGCMNEALRGGVSIKDFAQYPYVMLKRGDSVRSQLDDAFTQTGIMPRILMETENIQTAFSLSVMGMGITAYPEMFLRSVFTVSRPDIHGRDDVECFPITDIPAEMLYVATRRYHRLGPRTLEFIETLKACLSQWSLNEPIYGS